MRAYSDESGFPNKRYHVVSVVSGSAGALRQLRGALENVLRDSGVSELKFEQVRSHRPKIKAARNFIRLAVQYTLKRKIRVDVLVWDTQDSRHAILGRDDSENLKRMYYKVLVHVARKWRQQVWDLYPDEQSGIDWAEIQSYLNRTSIIRKKPDLLYLFEPVKEHFLFHSVTPQVSKAEPLVQLADLFGGMAAFSREKGERYQKWLSTQQSQQQLAFIEVEEDLGAELSKGDKVRFKLLYEFDTLCKRSRMGVSLKTRGYLWTPDPANPINFWNYEPQHEEDKAPTRPAGAG